MREALGLIEAIGLATAYEAADAAVKAANVRLIGMEACKGDGMHTVKLAGDVGAVTAGVAAAKAACAKGRGCFGAVVIARPAEQIEPLTRNARPGGAPAQDSADTAEDGGEGAEEELLQTEVSEEVVIEIEETIQEE